MSKFVQFQKFFIPSKALSNEHQRFYIVLALMFILAAFVHVFYLFLFLWMDLEILTLFNLFSIVVFITTIWLIRQGRIYASATLGALEIICHVALCSYYLGLESGIIYTLFTPALAIGISPLHRWYKTILFFVISIEAVLISLLFGDRVWVGSDITINLFHLFNFLMVFVVVVVAGLYLTSLVRNAEHALEEALAQSDALLNNVMPSVIAGRLKKTNEVIADSFPDTSILFADIVDFTPLSKSMTPVEVVSLLNDLFSRIDVLVEKYNLEKIKTIGDAYMVAAGVPIRRSDHAEVIVAFAIDLQKTLIAYNQETGYDLQFRIGINSGPVVAGVIGKLRFLYDLWGDSVNTASRMESHGIPNEIQVTEETRKILLGKYKFEDRGIVDIKGKGPMRTYLLRV